MRVHLVKMTDHKGIASFLRKIPNKQGFKLGTEEQSLKMVDKVFAQQLCDTLKAFKIAQNSINKLATYEVVEHQLEGV